MAWEQVGGSRDPGPNAAFLKQVRTAARPYRDDGWEVGASGLRRLDPSGHWAHFWFHGLKSTTGPWIHLMVGTISPYLLRTYNQQHADRSPSWRFYAVHSRFEPLEFELVLEAGDAPDPVPLDQAPRERTLSLGAGPAWLDARLAAALPVLAARSNDEALLAHLAGPDARGSIPDLRYAALLAYHLRRDDQLTDLLARAEAATLEAAERHERETGRKRRYRDRQMTYPQDWSHRRFVQLIEDSPRD